MLLKTKFPSQNLRHRYFYLIIYSLVFAQIGFSSENGESKAKSPNPTGEETSSDTDFQMKLDIENGHIGHVYIGCKAGATDGFDNRIDDMAPPPGMGGVGYTFLVSPDRKYNLYRDIRGFSAKVQWVFYAKVGSKPVTLSWEPDSIPNEWNLYCGKWDGKSETLKTVLNCRDKTSIQTNKTGFIRFWVEKEPTPKN